MLLAKHFDQSVADLRRRGRHLDTGPLHRGGLGFRVALAARNDRAGVAHAAAGWGGAARDEADHRLLAAFLGLVDQELRRVLFRGATDFADHHDRLGLRIGEEEFQAFDEVHSFDGIAADAERGRLAEPFPRRLEYGLVGERAGARRDAGFAWLGGVARHDADLAFARRHHARTVRADEARLGPGERALHLHHVGD